MEKKTITQSFVDALVLDELMYLVGHTEPVDLKEETRREILSAAPALAKSNPLRWFCDCITAQANRAIVDGRDIEVNKGKILAMKQLRNSLLQKRDIEL
jgi:hypothetical protein